MEKEKVMDLVEREKVRETLYAFIPGFRWKTIDKIVDDIPSAQPEIIRCKDCKHYSHPWYCEAWNNSPGFPAVSDDMFCSFAERRTDG